MVAHWIPIMHMCFVSYKKCPTGSMHASSFCRRQETLIASLITMDIFFSIPVHKDSHTNFQGLWYQLPRIIHKHCHTNSQGLVTRIFIPIHNDCLINCQGLFTSIVIPILKDYSQGLSFQFWRFNHKD